MAVAPRMERSSRSCNVALVIACGCSAHIFLVSATLGVVPAFTAIANGSRPGFRSNERYTLVFGIAAIALYLAACYFAFRSQRPEGQRSAVVTPIIVPPPLPPSSESVARPRRPSRASAGGVVVHIGLPLPPGGLPPLQVVVMANIQRIRGVSDGLTPAHARGAITTSSTSSDSGHGVFSRMARIGAATSSISAVTPSDATRSVTLQ